MIRSGMRLLTCALAVALGACASAPMHYYTLVPPAASAEAVKTTGMPFELLPVSVPAQVDQPQMVVRQGQQGVVLLDGERWIAPLGDEIRSALSAQLSQDLHSQDVSGMAHGAQPLLRIKLDVRRFESSPGQYALVEGAWSLRELHARQDRSLACTSRIREPVGAGYDALVQGHQRAIAQLATQIAAAASQWQNGQAASCPTS
jgi:hypothetical protein